MNARQIGLSLVLADFLTLTGWALYEHGLSGMFALIGTNLMSVTLSVDLLLALSMLSVWMWKDAKAHGMNPVPYLLLTCGAGSAGPLLYLIRRESVRAGARDGALAAAV